jgi:hypothetical protein
LNEERREYTKAGRLGKNDVGLRRRTTSSDYVLNQGGLHAARSIASLWICQAVPRTSRRM